MAIWIQKTHIFRRDEYICSNCGCRLHEHPLVCPRCNSVMDGSHYDPNWVDELEEIDMIIDD